MGKLSRQVVSASLLLGLAVATPALSQSADLTSTAERTGFKRTGRYQESIDLGRALARKWPRSVRMEEFGTTPEGRAMVALVVSTSGKLAPGSGQPVVLIQGGIHAGEVDGKDGAYLALRELLESQSPILSNITVVFVPVFNADGHERFGPWNRPNQVGPEEMGWRVTSQNLNLNRDYAKAETPEMQAMLGLLASWDPILYVDLHATDGAQFQPDVAILVEPIWVGDPALKPWARALREETLAKLTSQGSMPLPYYPSLEDPLDPLSGFADGAYPPRFSTGYWALRNRLAVLVETHSWKDYETRVRVSKNTVTTLLELASRHGVEWVRAAGQAEQNCLRLAGAMEPLRFKATKQATTIDFPGYAFEVEQSSVSGGPALRYRPEVKENWRLPFYGQVEPDLVVQAPGGGYLIPPTYAPFLRPHLDRHRVEYLKVEDEMKPRPLEVFRATEVTFSSRPSEGHQTAKMVGEWSVEEHPIARGSLFVPISQPKARLVMALLEPQAPDSYAAWGYFNAHFEQKEYMEEYVVELAAPEMLKRSEIATEFQARLKTDPNFAASPQARLEFFYRRHPAWDSRYNLYPISRTGSDPVR